MNLDEENSQSATHLEIQAADRWQMYYRLQELGIPCWCRAYQPLKVQLTTVAEAIQIWSIAQRLATPRCTLVQWLESCWKI